MRIHVVEDDAGVSDSLSLTLAALGHDVVAHRTAEALFAAPPPRGDDTVIVDLSLPGIQGAQVVRWLAELAAPPRIVVISGQSQGAIDHQLRGFPPLVLLRKPLDLATLNSLVAEV